MGDTAHDLVLKMHGAAIEQYQLQRKKQRALVEAMFREALERERQEEARQNELMRKYHGEAIKSLRSAVELPNGIPAAELREAQPGEVFNHEWNTYRREVGRLLAEGHEGRHVLIKGTEVVGVFDTWEDAAVAGRQGQPPTPFLVHPVRSAEPPLRVRGLNLPCPNSRSR